MRDEIEESKTKKNGAVRTERFEDGSPTREQKALHRNLQRSATEAPAPRLKVSDGSRSIYPDHPNEVIGYKLLAEALGTTSQDFVEGLLCQLAGATSRGEQLSESDLNFALSVVKDIKPNDQIEAMLAAQMAVIHIATMTFAGRLAQVETLPLQDSAERALNKLARTYAAHMEALKRYRIGGEQKVTVQHVYVNDSAQAIVGNVVQTARSRNPQRAAHTVPALTDARRPAMPIIEELESELIPLKCAEQDDE